MKKNVYLILALILSLSACNNEAKFLVEGVVTGAENKTLYFEESGIEGISSLDSVKLKNNGTFKFTQKRPEAPEFYRLRIDNDVINFAVDSTETVHVQADVKDFSTNYIIEGSENNIKIKELVLLQNELQKQANKIIRSNIPVGVVQDSLLTIVNRYKEKVKRNYIFAEPNKIYAYFALFQTLNGYMIYDPYTNKEDVKCFAAVATSMNNAYPHSDRSRNLYNMVIKGMKNTRPVKMDTLDFPIDKVQEAGLIDVPLRDLNGEIRHLTDLKGKVVLLDFTVYNNALSSSRNLALREIFNKYASKGLEIYQVSLDTDEHFWKTQADNLPWICVRDANGVYSTYVNLYSVAKIPTLFLISRSNELKKRYDTAESLEVLEKDIQANL